MKKLSFFALLLSFTAPLAFAGPFDLTCITDPPTTTIGIWPDGDDVKVRIIHHNGSRFAPAISGIFTPHDIPYVSENARLVEEKMPVTTTFRWPAKNCRRSGAVIRCFHTPDVQEGVGGAKLQPFAMHTAAILEESIAGRNEYISIAVSFDIDGRSGPRIEMKYPKESCSTKESRPLAEPKKL